MAATVLEQYTYDVNVQEGGAAEASVKVVAWNTAGSQAFSVTTDAQGDITQQSVEAASHSVAGFVTTTSDRNPFRIRAVKYGNRTFQIEKNITVKSADTLFTSANPDVTEATKATVDAYTGITISHAGDSVTLDGTGITPVNDVNRLYDRLQSDGFDSPQYEYIAGSDVAEVMSTGDKQNYGFNYDLVVSGFSFDGQSRAVALGTGRDLTVQGAGGNVSSLGVTGDAVLGAGADMTTITGLDVSGDVDLSSGGTPRTITLSGCTWGSVSSTTAGWTLNLIDGSTITTNNDPGNITVSSPASVTVKGLQQFAEVRAYQGTDPATATQIGSGQADAQGEFVFAHTSGGQPGYLVVRDLDYENPEIELTWQSGDQEILLTQRPDRTYFNPP